MPARADTAADWSIAQDLAVLIAHERENRIFAIWCARLVLSLVRDKEVGVWIRQGLAAAERYARGIGTLKELLDFTEHVQDAAMDSMWANCGEYGEPSYQEKLEWTPRLTASWVCKAWLADGALDAVYFARQAAIADVRALISMELRRVIAAIEAEQDSYPSTLVRH